LSSVTIKTLPIPLCSVRGQKKLASALDEVADNSRRLEAIYQQKLASLAELKQSILQKAFVGELTAQPDHALQEAVA
jgi:type I restriction enzyme S subunit